MTSDRATLANVLAELRRADEYLTKEYYDRPNPTPYRVRKAWNAIWYVEGKIRCLLAEPLPSVVERDASVADAVDEATAEAETWD